MPDVLEELARLVPRAFARVLEGLVSPELLGRPHNPSFITVGGATFRPPQPFLASRRGTPRRRGSPARRPKLEHRRRRRRRRWRSCPVALISARRLRKRRDGRGPRIPFKGLVWLADAAA